MSFTFNQEKGLLRDYKTSRNLREGSIKALVGRGRDEADIQL